MRTPTPFKDREGTQVFSGDMIAGGYVVTHNDGWNCWNDSGGYAGAIETEKFLLRSKIIGNVHNKDKEQTRDFDKEKGRTYLKITISGTNEKHFLEVLEESKTEREFCLMLLCDKIPDFKQSIIELADYFKLKEEKEAEDNNNILDDLIL